MNPAKLLDRRVVYKGKHVQVREDRVIEPSGYEASREIVVHPGAVCIVARPTPLEVILIRQYRHATGQELVEIPAGTLRQGEDPLGCAIRELEEETGYRAKKIEFLHAFFLSPGILDEKMHLYLATGLTAGETAREEGEEIENWLVPFDEAIAMIFRREIQDAKTIVSLLWVDRLLRERR